MCADIISENEKARAKDYELEEIVSKRSLSTDFNYKHEYIPIFVIIHSLLQIGWLYGFYVLFYHAKLATIIWSSTIGYTAYIFHSLGSHRYYSHKSFKASKSLQAAFLFFQTMLGQNSMYRWVREHRLHHKYSDTDADPHNAARGFFFSHMGWLMTKKHPLVKEKIKQINTTDLINDKLVMFQYKHYVILYLLIGFLLPISVPMIFFGESFFCSFFIAWNFMYVTGLHVTWLINSWAHKFGNRAFDARMTSTNSETISLILSSDGWHNYHHSFPWDCRHCELGTNGGFATNLLEFFEKIGLASDLKTASLDVVYGHIRRHGEKSARKEYLEKSFQKERETMKN